MLHREVPRTAKGALSFTQEQRQRIWAAYQTSGLSSERQFAISIGLGEHLFSHWRQRYPTEGYGTARARITVPASLQAAPMARLKELTGVDRPPYNHLWTQEQVTAVIMACNTLAMPQTQFCKETGISPPLLQKWRKQYDLPAKTRISVTQGAPVPSPGSATATTPAPEPEFEAPPTPPSTPPEPPPVVSTDPKTWGNGAHATGLPTVAKATRASPVRSTAQAPGRSLWASHSSSHGEPQEGVTRFAAPNPAEAVRMLQLLAQTGLKGHVSIAIYEDPNKTQ